MFNWTLIYNKHEHAYIISSGHDDDTTINRIT